MSDELEALAFAENRFAVACFRYEAGIGFWVVWVLVVDEGVEFGTRGAVVVPSAVPVDVSVDVEGSEVVYVWRELRIRLQVVEVL